MPGSSPRRRWTHVWVLAVSLVVTGAATVAFYLTTRELDRQRFANAVDEAEDRIADRVELYVAMLIAGRGVFEADPDVTSEEFRRFASHLDLERRYPGIQGIGFTRRVAPDERADLEAQMHARGVEGFHVWPVGPRDEYHPIVALEPMDRRNRAAIGFDMFSEPVRRAAMERARDSDAPAASGKVTLVQEIDPQKQAGFLIYVPVYDGDPRTEADRRAALRGFIYAPFRAGDLFDEALADTTRVDVEVYDGAPGAGALLHRTVIDAGGGQLSAVRRLDVAGQTWTIAFRSTPYFDSTSSAWLTPTVGGIGILTSLALFLVSWSQVRHRARAEALADDLTAAVRVRDDFVSIAGHELKTPLAALLLQLEGIDRLAAGGALGDPATLRNRLGRAIGQVGRLERLIGELLDVSRIAAGRLELHREEIDLAELVREIAERTAEQASRAGCELRVDAPAPVTGRWDRLRVDQVITNLVSNALKYGAGAPVEVAVVADGDIARVTVRDHGIGLSPEDAERIFGRFERAVSERHYGGLGLGLWISRQIVDAERGRIAVTPVPGPGAAFVVELPRTTPST